MSHVLRDLAVRQVLAAAAPARADIVGRASVIDGDTIEIHGQRVRLHVIRFPGASRCRRCELVGISACSFIV
jgi:endonuclease YncB( thermonuclease family)